MIPILRLTRPLNLLLSALTYLLGLSLANYLGIAFDGTAFWLGLAAVLLSQALLALLAEVFRPFADPFAPDETLIQHKALRDTLLYVSVGALVLLAILSYILYNTGHLAAPGVLFISISLLLTVLYGVPPMRLSQRGFGELILAIQVGYVIPSLGFLLQSGDYHRLLSMIVFPLTALAFAAFIALNFPTFAQDRKFARGSLLTVIGWERAVPLHHILIASAYFIFLAAPMLGFSLALLWPAFLSLPFSLLQIFWLRNIAQGGRPIWTLLTINAIAIVGLTAYFLTLTFWLR